MHIIKSYIIRKVNRCTSPSKPIQLHFDKRFGKVACGGVTVDLQLKEKASNFWDTLKTKGNKRKNAIIDPVPKFAIFY